MTFESYEQLAAYINENPKLTELEIDGDFSFIPALPSTLRRLTLRNCRNLNALPDIPCRLQYLAIQRCGIFQLPHLPLTLDHLELDDCPELSCPVTSKSVSLK